LPVVFFLFQGGQTLRLLSKPFWFQWKTEASLMVKALPIVISPLPFIIRQYHRTGYLGLYQGLLARAFRLDQHLVQFLRDIYHLKMFFCHYLCSFLFQQFFSMAFSKQFYCCCLKDYISLYGYFYYFLEVALEVPRFTDLCISFNCC
jgi:hypothetical protein